jgi:KDO2-lipid IV(A) lauroyltransferase
LYRFWQPRYWGLWLALVLLRAVTLLPFRWQLRLGGALGRAAMPLLAKRRAVVRVNLRLCFPDLDEAAIEHLVREHFAGIGMSMIEIALAWWISDERAGRLVAVAGAEHPRRAVERGHPIILVSGHFPGMEIAGMVAQRVFAEAAGMYRPVNNAFIDQVVRRARHRSVEYLVPKDGLRQMLRLLRRRIPVWYASDQAYDRKGSALVPFFGEPAMTNTALTNIARMSQAKVIPFLHRRRADLSGYDAVFLPPLDDFPSDDAAADALRVHRVLEEHIRGAPAQYYWLHRRFKNRPAPLPDVYADL